MNTHLLHHQRLVQNTALDVKPRWATFCAWCKLNKRLSLPVAPETLRQFVQELSRRNWKRADIVRSLEIIRSTHERAGFIDPTTANTVRFEVDNARRQRLLLKQSGQLGN